MSQIDDMVSVNTKDELVALAEEYELSTEGNKADLAERIVKFEAGVPQDAELGEPEPEPAAADPDAPTTLVRYKGKSRHFEAEGFTFDREKPFVVVLQDAADKLFDAYGDLFVPASRKQVEEYYS